MPFNSFIAGMILTLTKAVLVPVPVPVLFCSVLVLMPFWMGNKTSLFQLLNEMKSVRFSPKIFCYSMLAVIPIANVNVNVNVFCLKISVNF